ncbi:MAG: exodeoxyribonuclease III [Pseudomonadota bacterium]
MTDLRIATWNINGIKARLETVKTWLRETVPDVACLQEIKSVSEAFPATEFEDLGYNVAVCGQKSFNGVAILSKHPIEDPLTALPGDPDDVQARYLEATIATDDIAVRVASIYLPNGNPITTDKFSYKLSWMRRLSERATDLLGWDMPVVLAGDYNVIPEPRDAKAADRWLDDALFQPASRDAFASLANLGYVDAVRVCYPDEGVYTFWDYQAGAWQKNNGIRIDHIMMNAQATDLIDSTAIERDVRGWEKPSDHVPVTVTLRTD